MLNTMKVLIFNDLITYLYNLNKLNDYVLNNLLGAIYQNEIKHPLKNEWYLIYDVELFETLGISGNVGIIDENELQHPVFQKKYIFTILFRLLNTVPELQARVTELSARLLPGNSEPNKPEFLDNLNSTVTIGFDEVLRSDAMLLQQGLGVTIFKRQQNGKFEPVILDELPEV